MKRKSVVLVLVALIFVLSFVACTKTETSQEVNEPTKAETTNDESTDKKAEEPAPVKEEVVPMRYICSGASSASSEVIDEVNKKLAADGVPIEVEITHVDGGVFNDRLNIMFSTNEEFEMFAVSENRVSSIVYYNNGYMVPIDDMLDEYGPVLKDNFDAKTWEMSKIDGKTYTIPSIWKETSATGGESGVWGVRTDKLNEYGLEKPKTLDDLYNISVEMREKWGEDNLYIYPVASKVTNTMNGINRGITGYPFFVDYTTELVLIDQEGNVSSYYESPQFEETAKYMEKLYKEKLIHPDILTISGKDKNIIRKQGLFIFDRNGAQWTDSLKDIGYEYERFFVNPDVPSFTTVGTLNANAISTTTSHPEAGIRFLNWLYSSQENHDLMMFGVEGVHYNNVGDIRFEYINNAAGKPKHKFSFYQMGKKSWRKFSTSKTELDVQYYIEPADEILDSVALEFRFNPTNVEAEYQAVLAERPRSIIPVKFGVHSYDEYYEDAIGRLKAAGLDKVVAEYKRQFDEWYANKK